MIIKLYQQVFVQLGSERARVYVTGRNEKNAKIGRGFIVFNLVCARISSGRSQEALEDLAAEIKERGGEAVVNVCDHEDIEATEAIFRKIDQMVGTDGSRGHIFHPHHIYAPQK